MPQAGSARFDAVVVGTGQSGPALAGRLAGSGRKVAIVERKRFGGTCVNTGCTPTKALIASARAAHMARRAADFGVAIEGSLAVDMTRVKARKDAIVRDKRQGLEKWLREMENCTVYEGHARFETAHALRVGDALVEGERIFLNVGARAVEPKIPGLDSVPYLTDSTMMEIESLPEHLLILGGGYVALEFGQMYRRFGSAVTIVERGGRLAQNEDEEVSEALREILESEDVRVLTDTEASGFARDGAAVAITLEGKQGKTTERASHVLVAVGRRPNTDDLGLEAAGLESDDKGFIKVDEGLRTSVDHIWALGDCNGRGAFTHTSYDDFERLADGLLDGEPRPLSQRIPAYNIYTDPPLGRAGMTEAEVRKSGRKALVAEMPMTEVARAVEQSETRGFLKVLVDAESERILGAALLGLHCDEVIHSLIDVMTADAPYTAVRKAMHIHPTVSELLPTLLGKLEPLEA